MKNLIGLFFILVLCSISACNDDDESSEQGVVYTIDIKSPSEQAKHVGDTIHLHVNFDEINADVIHHVNISIKSSDGNSVLYNLPSDAHVHVSGGHHEHHDNVVLAVNEHTDWIMEAKVWGHEAGLGEVTKSIMFHVHP